MSIRAPIDLAEEAWGVLVADRCVGDAEYAAAARQWETVRTALDLGDAWAEAKAAIPEGHWSVIVWEDQGVRLVRAGVRRGFESEPRYSAEGPTPAAALRALAAKLRADSK
jgi:hypothetical protein